MAQVRRGTGPLDRSGETWNLIYRFMQHWLLALCCGVLFAGAGLLYAWRYQPLYHAEAQVRVGDSLRDVPGQKDDPSELVDMPDTLASGFRARVIVDPKLKGMVEELAKHEKLAHLPALQTEKGREDLIENIKKNVLVEAVTRRIFKIIYEANDADLVQIVVQRLAELGVADVAEERGKTSSEKREFLSRQAEVARQQMINHEAEVVRFLRDHPKLMINLSAKDKSKLGLNLQDRLLASGRSGSGGPAIAPLKELEVQGASPQVRALLGQRAELEAKVAMVEQRLKFDAMQVKNQELDKLQQQLMDLKAQGYTREYPEYQRITAEIERIHRDIREHGQQRDGKLAQDMRTVNEAKAQIAAIDRELAILKQKARGEDKPIKPDEMVLSAEAQYARLVRDMEASRTAYDKLHERELDAQVNEELSKVKGNLAARIEDPAKRPMRPRGVSRKMMMGLCVLLGLLLGAAMGLVRAFTDPLIYTVYDLARASRLPVLGRVPARDGALGGLSDVSNDLPETPARAGLNGRSGANAAVTKALPEMKVPQVDGAAAAAGEGAVGALPAAMARDAKRSGEYMVVYSAARTGQFPQVAAGGGEAGAVAAGGSDVAVWADKGLAVSARTRSGIFASPQSAAFRLAGMGHNVQKGKLEEHRHLFLLSAPDGARAEQYRLLRCRLQEMTDPKVIVVTSAVRGEGKTMAAANLALAYAEGGAHSVVMVDANLSSPELTEVLGAQPRAEALTEGDLTGGGLDIWQFEPNLFLVPAPGPRTKRSAVLSSPAFAMLIADLRQVFEYVIIDAPAASAADAKIVLRTADTGLFLTRARSTTAQSVRVALDRLGRGVMSGVVLNEFSRS